ncbi:serine/threonine protein phosphatase PrpC [Sphingomonas sp. UYAg733]
MNAPLRIEAVVATHVGLVRKANEDSYCTRAADGLWVVADGMGGHAHGDWASRILADELAIAELPAEFDAACHAIAGAIHTGNARIWREAQARGQQMGSTVAALFIRDRRFGVLWVGDSRIYLFRDARLHQLTRDHTQVQEMVDRGLLQPHEAASHPRGHVLARAVGVQGVLEVDVVVDAVEPGDVFLLCSDGLTGQVPDVELAELLAQGSDRQATLDRLIALTLDRGAPDNVTALVVGVQEATLLSFALPGSFA